MSDSVSVTFTAAELRQLRALVRALLSEPLGVYPGPEADARARVTAAMKVLRADADASHKKFIDLPTLAPFASRVIVEQLAPATGSTPARVSGTRKRMASATNGARQSRTAAARGRRRETVASLPLDGGCDAPSPKDR